MILFDYKRDRSGVRDVGCNMGLIPPRFGPSKSVPGEGQVNVVVMPPEHVRE